MIELKLVNNLTITSAAKQPEPLQQLCTNMRGNKICMYSLDTSHRQFEITPEDKFQYQ